MIPKKNRFHGLGSLNQVYKSGKGSREGAFALKFKPVNRDDFRLAVVVSKKVSKSAVKRNKIRRRVYEAVRQIKFQDNGAWKYDLIITCFDDSAENMPYEELVSAIEKLLKKAKITTS